MANVRRVAAELLAKRHRHGVLKMRAASLEDGGKAAALFGQAVRQFPRGRDEIAQLEEDRQPRRRRIHVVGRLSHVDVIVGVHPPVGATTVPEDLGGAVGKHLVRVHVVRSAGARLVDVDDKLIAQPPLEHVVGGPDDRSGKRRREAAEPPVGLSRSLLDQDGCRDERGRCGETANREVLHGARRLPAIVGICRDTHLSQRIAFDAKVARGMKEV